MGTIRQRDLQGAGSKVDTGTGDALRLEPHKDICAEAVIHVVPGSKHMEKCSVQAATCHLVPEGHCYSNMSYLLLGLSTSSTRKPRR